MYHPVAFSCGGRKGTVLERHYPGPGSLPRYLTICIFLQQQQPLLLQIERRLVFRELNLLVCHIESRLLITTLKAPMVVLCSTCSTLQRRSSFQQSNHQPLWPHGGCSLQTLVNISSVRLLALCFAATAVSSSRESIQLSAASPLHAFSAASFYIGSSDKTVRAEALVAEQASPKSVHQCIQSR